MQVEIRKTFIEIVDYIHSFRESASKSAPACCFRKPESDSNEAIDDDEPNTTSTAPGTPSTWSDSNEDIEDDEPITPPRTTVMIRNIPPSYTRSMLLNLLDQEGFACQYDFVYLPIRIRWNKPFGYAFVNFVNETVGESFLKHFANFSRWGILHNKCAEVDWAKDDQGLEAQVQRYIHSSLMQANSPDELKPIVLKAGTRVAFPEPTEVLAESKSKIDDTTKQTWGHLCHGIGEEGFAQVSSHLPTRRPDFHMEDSKDKLELRAQKKVERSVKRIKIKLVKTGRRQNL